jgi:hypothetical protein
MRLPEVCFSCNAFFMRFEPLQQWRLLLNISATIGAMTCYEKRNSFYSDTAESLASQFSRRITTIYREIC